MSENTKFILRKGFDEKQVTSKPEICARCKGVDCCQHAPCAYAPDDFQVFRYSYSKVERINFLIHLLKKGDISIDHRRFYNQMTGAYDLKSQYNVLETFLKEKKVAIDREKLMNLDGILYLRPRAVNRGVIDTVHLTPDLMGLTCSMWDPETGCKYKYEQRPKGGRLLIPCEETVCIQMYSEYNAMQDWARYQDVMYEVYQYFFNK